MKTETRFTGLTQVVRRSAGELGLGALVLLGCLGAAPTAARADISWTFNNVNFSVAEWTPTGTVYTEVASLSGSFSTNNAATTVTSFSDLKITAQPGDSKYAFTVAGIDDAYLPGTIGIYATGWSSYIDLTLTSPLTSPGGSYSFSSGYDCPGCAVLPPDNGAGVVGAGTQVVTGDIEATPEPGFYAVLALGLSGLLFAGWRRSRA
jgi:hypothetical protein